MSASTFVTTPPHCTSIAPFSQGGIVAVAGASGSGKSTLFHVIAGFEEPDRGEVRILGKTMSGQAPAERPVSVIFQDNNLFAHLDVATNVGFGISPCASPVGR